MILTGMGNDGSKGMLALREAGGRTMAQDESSSVVFGMPKEAYATGGAEKLVPLDRIADEVIRLFTRNP
jgi:two-component system chemotaxis response regulator CheB